MIIKIIHTETDYEAAIDEIKRLIISDPATGSEEANRLDILFLLVEKYEEDNFHFDLPDPISAIKFVMEQKKLKQTDLIKYIGSRSKVSEILSGKRPLSLNMIRKLNEELGIPAEILLKKPGASIPENNDIIWEKFPINEMKKKKWFDESVIKTDKPIEFAEELMRPKLELLYDKCVCPHEIDSTSLNIAARSSVEKFRSKKEIDVYALTAWQAQVVEKAVNHNLASSYNGIDENFLRVIAMQSINDVGPQLAKKLLNKYGIHLIILPHLNHTYLDGAVMLLKNGNPLIGLTLRHDRLDNFWFSLLHELAHLLLHFKDDNSPYFDDFDDRSEAIHEYEKQADSLAGDVLLSEEKWSKNKSFDFINSRYSYRLLSQIARHLQVNEAILLGRIQHDTKNWQILRKSLGKGIPSNQLS